ncbi:MAG: hypothetical protein HYY16_14180 [Planctomycetes bacterium]|nr:hypothetical protein [Planctomycetota bacterium]
MGRIIALAASIACLSACSQAPPHVTWQGNALTIHPNVPQPQGALVVETEITRQVDQESGATEERRPFFVYTDDGIFLRSEQAEFPINLSPGRYIVVARVGSKMKQVQAILESDRTTRVHVFDFESSEAGIVQCK